MAKRKPSRIGKIPMFIKKLCQILDVKEHKIFRIWNIQGLFLGWMMGMDFKYTMLPHSPRKFFHVILNTTTWHLSSDSCICTVSAVHQTPISISTRIWDLSVETQTTWNSSVENRPTLKTILVKSVSKNKVNSSLTLIMEMIVRHCTTKIKSWKDKINNSEINSINMSQWKINWKVWFCKWTSVWIIILRIMKMKKAKNKLTHQIQHNRITRIMFVNLVLASLRKMDIQTIVKVTKCFSRAAKLLMEKKMQFDFVNFDLLQLKIPIHLRLFWLTF